MMKEVAGDDEGGPADNQLEVRDKSVTQCEKPRLYANSLEKIFHRSRDNDSWLSINLIAVEAQLTRSLNNKPLNLMLSRGRMFAERGALSFLDLIPQDGL
jgi:hypothetical protein